MSLLKALAGLAVGAAAVGAAAYLLNRDEHTEEYEHIVGPEDEVEPETDSPAEPDVDASAEAETAPAAAPEAPAAPAEPETPAAPAEPEETAAPTQTPDPAEDVPHPNPVELGQVEVPKTEDGKLDATKIADPADFSDWVEQGCKG